MSVLKRGDLTQLPYSSTGLTRLTNNFLIMTLSRHENVFFIVPRMLLAFFVAVATCSWKFSLLSTITPRSFSAVVSDNGTCVLL